MAEAWFTATLINIGLQDFDLGYRNMRVMLLADTFDLGALATATRATDAAITDHEVVGDGYTAGGLGTGDTDGRYLAVGDGTWEATLISNPQWPSSTITARYGVMYTEQYDALLYLMDFGSNKVTNNETFEIVLSQTSPLFTVNTTPGYLTELIVNRGLDSYYSSVYSGDLASRPYFYLVTSDYVPDLASGSTASITANYVAHVEVDVYTYSMEGGELVYRVDNDIVTIPLVTGTFRYLVVTQRSDYSWMTLHDFGSDQIVNSADVAISLPNGFHKVVLLP